MTETLLSFELVGTEKEIGYRSLSQTSRSKEVINLQTYLSRKLLDALVSAYKVILLRVEWPVILL